MNKGKNMSHSEDMNVIKNQFQSSDMARQNSVSKFSTQNNLMRMGPAAGSGAYTKKQKVGILEVDTQISQRATTARNPIKTTSKLGYVSRLNKMD